MLDEITYVINWGWVPIADVVEAIRNRPEKVSIVSPGATPPRS